MIMPGWQDYALSIDRMCSAVWGGQDPKAALQKAAAEWDASTQRLGVPAQKAAYQEFLKIPGLLRRPHDREGRSGGAYHLRRLRKLRPRARADRRAVRASLRGAVGHGPSPSASSSKTTMGQTATAGFPAASANPAGRAFPPGPIAISSG